MFSVKRLIAFVPLLVLLLMGCGGAPPNAPVVRPGEMRSAEQFAEPVWIAFEPGDVLPVYVDVEGVVFEMKSPPVLELKVHKRVYLLVGDGPPKLSYDRKTFITDGKSSFGFGIGNSKVRGPHVNVVVRHRTEH